MLRFCAIGGHGGCHVEQRRKHVHVLMSLFTNVEKRTKQGSLADVGMSGPYDRKDAI